MVIKLLVNGEREALLQFRQISGLGATFYRPDDDCCQKHQDGNLIDAVHHA